MKTIQLLLAVAAASLVSACGDGGDRDALVRAFVEADLSQEQSECMADRARQDMEPALYDAMVDAARSNDDTLDTLSTGQQLELAQFMAVAGIDCSGIAFE